MRIEVDMMKLAGAVIPLHTTLSMALIAP